MAGTGRLTAYSDIRSEFLSILERRADDVSLIESFILEMVEGRDDREGPEETIKLFREVQKEDLFFVNRSGAGSTGNTIKVVQRLIIVLISTGVGVTITSKVVPDYESEAIALFLIIVATIFLFYCIEVAGILWTNLSGVSIEMGLGLLDMAKKSRHFKDFRNDYKAEGKYGKLLNASANFF